MQKDKFPIQKDKFPIQKDKFSQEMNIVSLRSLRNNSNVAKV